MLYRVLLTLLLSLVVAGCGYKTDLTLPDDDAETLVYMPVSEKLPQL